MSCCAQVVQHSQQSSCGIQLEHVQLLSVSTLNVLCTLIDKAQALCQLLLKACQSRLAVRMLLFILPARPQWQCRYATPGGFRESALAAGLRGEDLQNLEKQKQARQRMYTPGGPMARELAKNPTVLIVNDTLFAHGGVLKRHGTNLIMSTLTCCNIAHFLAPHAHHVTCLHQVCNIKCWRLIFSRLLCSRHLRLSS